MGAKQAREYLHVVDLDGAKAGEPVNLDQLRASPSRQGCRCSTAAGCARRGPSRDALAAGAARVILGTAAFADPELLGEVLAAHGPERVLVGVDVRGGQVATHGWLQSTGIQARDAFAQLRQRGARHFVFTNVDHDGMLDGANRDEVAWVARAAGDGSVIISGGIGRRGDLEALADLRREMALDALDGVIVGTALYEARFTVAEGKQALADGGQTAS